MEFSLLELNFIFQFFVQSNVPSVVLFHCWDREAVKFGDLSLNSRLLFQFVRLDDRIQMDRLVYQNFNHRGPINGVFLDFNCHRSLEVIEATSSDRFFNMHYRWLIYDSQSHIKRFRRIFNGVNLSWNTDLTYAHPSLLGLLNATFIVYDVYNNGWSRGGKLNITIDKAIACNIKKCWTDLFLSTLHLKSKFWNRRALSDITLKVSTLAASQNISRPYEEILNFLRSIERPHIDPIARMGYNQLMLLKDMLGVKMELMLIDQWSTNDTKGGSIGLVVNESVDMSSSGFVITPGRLKNLTPTAKVGTFHSICMFRTPRNAGIKGDVFLEPFSTGVWLVFILSILLITCLLSYTFHVEHYHLKNFSKSLPSFILTFLITFGSACIQGSSLLPSSNGGRIAFLSLTITSFIMYNCYTSIVVSSLLGSPVKSSIKTIDQLADSNLDLALEPIAYTLTYLNTSPRSDIRHLVKNKIEKKDPSSIWLPVEIGVKKMRDFPGFAYVFEASTGFNMIERTFQPHEICDLNEVQFRPETSLYSFFHKNQTYRELFRVLEIRTLETGVHFKHRRYWMREKLHCLTNNNFIINVGLEYTAPLFFLLLSGYTLVVFALFLELFWHKKSKGPETEFKGGPFEPKLKVKGFLNH